MNSHAEEAFDIISTVKINLQDCAHRLMAIEEDVVGPKSYADLDEISDSILDLKDRLSSILRDLLA